jgi:hypothetical protein
MLGKNTKKLILGVRAKLQKIDHRLLPAVQLCCFKGYEPHYKWLEEQDRLSLPVETKVYSFDKAAVDLALEMSVRRRQLLTLVSDTHYETVTITAQ